MRSRRAGAVIQTHNLREVAGFFFFQPIQGTCTVYMMITDEYLDYGKKKQSLKMHYCTNNKK